MRVEEAFQLGKAAARSGKPRHYTSCIDFVAMLRDYTKIGDNTALGAALRSSFYAGFDYGARERACYSGDYAI